MEITIAKTNLSLDMKSSIEAIILKFFKSKEKGFKLKLKLVDQQNLAKTTKPKKVAAEMGMGTIKKLERDQRIIIQLHTVTKIVYQQKNS